MSNFAAKNQQQMFEVQNRMSPRNWYWIIVSGMRSKASANTGMRSKASANSNMRSNNLVPRLSLLCLPLSLGGPWLRLVTWPPVTQTFSPGWSQQIIFVDINWSERKAITGTGKYTFEILQSYSKLHTGQTKLICMYPAYTYHSLFQFQPVELSVNCFIACCLN